MSTCGPVPFTAFLCHPETGHVARRGVRVSRKVTAVGQVEIISLQQGETPRACEFSEMERTREYMVSYMAL